MKLARIEEGILVVADTPLVEPGRTAVATVVTQGQVQNLPINGRNFLSFTVMSPGVTTDRTPQQGATATSGLSFTGQRGRSNNVMVDGFDNNDATLGAVRATFSQEAVREFQVLTSSYSASDAIRAIRPGCPSVSIHCANADLPLTINATGSSFRGSISWFRCSGSRDRHCGFGKAVHAACRSGSQRRR
jgi:hypothetical protein